MAAAVPRHEWCRRLILFLVFRGPGNVELTGGFECWTRHPHWQPAGFLVPVLWAGSFRGCRAGGNRGALPALWRCDCGTGSPGGSGGDPSVEVASQKECGGGCGAPGKDVRRPPGDDQRGFDHRPPASGESGNDTHVVHPLDIHSGVFHLSCGDVVFERLDGAMRDF